MGKYRTYYKLWIKLTKEEIKKEKETFLRFKQILYDYLKFYIDNINIESKFPDEEEMDKYIKNKIVNDISGYYINEYMDYFFQEFGILYSKLDPIQKKELINSDLTYESLSNFSKKVTEDYINDCKKVLPEKVKECFDDYCFPMYCQTERDNITKPTEANFLKYIRDYFILDQQKDNFEDFRNKEKFDIIRDKMKNIYGELKDKYDGKNPFIERYFIRFFIDSDYNYKETTELLDEYYKNNKNNKNKDNNNYQLIKQNQD